MNESDVTRIQEFRQLKEEIPRSRDYLVVGIDVAKNKHNAFFGTATGKTLSRRNMTSPNYGCTCFFHIPGQGS